MKAAPLRVCSFFSFTALSSDHTHIHTHRHTAAAATHRLAELSRCCLRWFLFFGAASTNMSWYYSFVHWGARDKPRLSKSGVCLQLIIGFFFKVSSPSSISAWASSTGTSFILLNCREDKKQHLFDGFVIFAFVAPRWPHDSVSCQGF